MPHLLEEVWLSIFTPGPTPPLLLATNVTFAALQLILALLLFFTYSIHFLVLSGLCAGLWWSINWFAREVMRAAEEEEARKRADGLGRREVGESGVDEGKEGVGSAMDGGDEMDTETETETDMDASLRSNLSSSRDSGQAGTAKAGPTISAGPAQASAGKDEGSMFNTSAAARLAPTDNGVRKRRSLAESTGDLSTDSEWEKVEDVR